MEPNPYPLSPQAQALNEYLARQEASLNQATGRAKEAVGGWIGSATDAVGNAMAPDERQLANQAAWQEKLRISRGNTGVLEQLLMRIRGQGQQPQAAQQNGSLAAIMNSRREAGNGL